MPKQSLHKNIICSPKCTRIHVSSCLASCRLSRSKWETLGGTVSACSSGCLGRPCQHWSGPTVGYTLDSDFSVSIKGINTVKEWSTRLLWHISTMINSLKRWLSITSFIKQTHNWPLLTQLSGEGQRQVTFTCVDCAPVLYVLWQLDAGFPHHTGVLLHHLSRQEGAFGAHRLANRGHGVARGQLDPLLWLYSDNKRRIYIWLT